MRMVIGIVLPLHREMAGGCFMDQKCLKKVKVRISVIYQKVLKAKFYDDIEQRLYLHFDEPVDEELLKDYFDDEELIFGEG